MVNTRRVVLVCLLLCTSTLIAAPPPPAQVSAPSPVNGATSVPITALLSWAAPSRAQRYDVYFGQSQPLALVSADQTATSYQPTTLSVGTTYFWHVDSKNQSGTTTGSVWSFTTSAAPPPPPPPPGQPANPSPSDSATSVAATSTTLAWSAASGATSYDVAFGSTSPPPLVAQQQTVTQFNPGALATSTIYYWQITARNSAGATAGPIWKFTTATGTSGGSTTVSRLKLLTWNIQHGYDASTNEVIDDQVALMIDSGADVIGLQEITIEQGKDLSTLYKAKLEAATGYTWNSVWAPAPRAPIYTPEGDLILTRLPILSSSTAAWDTMPGSPDIIGAKRAAAQVQLVVNNQPVNIIVTHLDTDVTTRSQQLSLLLQWASTFAAPRIIGGDFNMMPSETDHATMAAKFPDAWSTLINPFQSPPEPGYTKDVRTISPWIGQPGRIDYWFHDTANQHAVPTEIAVLKTRRSDHNALLMWVKVQ
jgi:endonuclease/exonuclease/phosphatase family metal-dependent hydrolase